MGFGGCAKPRSVVVDRNAGDIAERHLDRAELSEQTRWMLAVRDTGDRQAFAKLFDYFAPRLKTMAMRGGASEALAEEIAQDAMLRVWRNAAQFDPARAQVSGWVYQIGRNRQIDLARRAPRAVLDEVQVPWTDTDVASALALEQEAVQLRRALAILPQAQRELVEKAYMGELTHQEISRETMLPLGTVKSRLRLALERLRHELRGLRR